MVARVTRLGREESPAVTVRYRILGPIELHDGGVKAALGGPRQVALLAYLLLQANHAVSTDAVIEGLWPDHAARGAAKRLHVAVARLRKVLAPQTVPSPLKTLSGGYVLRTQPGELDADVFDEHFALARAEASKGQHLAAIALFDEMLRMWRGPPLADVGYEDFAQTEIRRLEELRLAAIEARAESSLAMGQHVELASELEPVVALHPQRERLCGQLMLALYRCGRQIEALDAYQRTYRELVSAIGLEPGPALRLIQQRILEHSDALAAPAGPGSLAARDAAPVGIASRRAPVPPLLASVARVPFVGRDDARSRLSECWDDAARNRRSLGVLAGEPGIGKTATAAQFAADVHNRGGDVLYGACEPQSVVPYHPVTGALREHFRHVPPPWRSNEWLNDVAAVLRLTPKSRHSPPRSTSADDERYWLFEGVLRILERLADARPLLLIVDDLHWAEPSTLMMLRHVARDSDPADLMLLATYRDAEIPADSPVRDMWSSARLDRVEEIALAGLHEDDTAALIAADTGIVVSPRSAARWHQRTGGHPFFLRELLRSADPEDIERAQVADLPDGVRELLLRRTAKLTEVSRATLRTAAVIGREFDLPLLARLLGETPDATLAALEQAIAAGLVVELTDRADRFAFVHALVRETLYESQTQSRRIRVHVRVAQALEEMEAPAAELAHHFFAARQILGAQRAVQHAKVAAHEAIASLAYEDAAEHFQRALTALGDELEPSETERCELLLALGDAEARAGEPRAEETFARAAACARRLGDAHLLARAALAGRQSEPAYRDEARIAVLSEALAALGGERVALRAEILARLASVLHFGSTGEQARAVSAEALELASEISDTTALIAALHGRHAALMHVADVDERLELLDRLVVVAERTAQPDFVALGREWSIYARLELGDLACARTELERFSAVARERRQPRFDHALLAWQAVFALLDGRLPEAERLAHAGHRLAGRIQIANAEALFASQLCFIRRDQDRLSELLPVIRPYAATSGDFLWQAGLAVALAAVGERDSAWSVLEPAGRHSYEDVPQDFWWLPTIALFAEACARVGDPRGAADLYRLLEPYAERHVQLVFAAHLGCVHRFLGLAAASVGDERQAREHLEAAWGRHADLGAAALRLRSACDLASMLIVSGRREDRLHAEELLRIASAEATGTTLEPLIARLVREALYPRPPRKGLRVP